MKIVFLDRKTIGEDIDLSSFNRFGEVVIYDFSKPEEVPARVEDADIIVLNKVPVNEKTIGTAKNLKLVCVTATGVNNLDLDYLAAKNIAWRNVAGYSTQTVTQQGTKSTGRTTVDVAVRPGRGASSCRFRRGSLRRGRAP